MILHQLGMKFGQLMNARVGRWHLSFERLYDLLAVYMVKAQTPQSLRDINPDHRHITRDKRSRQSSIELALNSLT